MAVPRTGKSGLEGALRTSEGPFGMVERHKTGEIALLRPSLGKKALLWKKWSEPGAWADGNWLSSCNFPVIRKKGFISRIVLKYCPDLDCRLNLLMARSIRVQFEGAATMLSIVVITAKTFFLLTKQPRPLRKPCLKPVSVTIGGSMPMWL